MRLQNPADDHNRYARGWWAIFALALLVRLAALPFATLDSADSTARVQVGWLWSENPFYIAAGGWGPLHYYLVGAAMRLWPDPILAPALLHIVCGALLAVFAGKLAGELFRDTRAALLTGLCAAIYPLAIVTSLEAHAEVPNAMFLMMAMTWLVRAWRPEGHWRQAAVAGLCMTLATALRYEMWLVLPMLALPLLLARQWRNLFAYGATAALHPLAWMIGNTVRFGNPLYSFKWSDDFERVIMKHSYVADITRVFEYGWGLALATERGLSLPLALLAGAGVALTLWRWQRERLWLAPLFGLFCVWVAAGARGSLWIKPSYTLNFGTLALPFAAAAFLQLRTAGFWKPALAVVAAVALTAVTPLWRAVPMGGAIVSQVTARFPEDREAAELLRLVGVWRGPQDGALISDFVGWSTTGYLFARTKVHPSRSCSPNGTPVPVDLPAVQQFLLDNREGTLLQYDKGRLTARMEVTGPGQVSLAGVGLALSNERRFPWSGEAGSGVTPPGEITVTRYRVISEPATRYSEKPQCTTPCPVSLCSI